MGILSTYGELKQGILDYHKRASVITTRLPIFVMRAHTTLMRELDIPLLQETTDLTIDGERIVQPVGFRAVERLHIDADWDNPLSPATIQNRQRWASDYSAGRPRVFSVEGNMLAFGPVPDATYTGKLLYRKALDFFASDSDANVLLLRHPFAYLYGALAEAARFDRYDEDVATYEAMFRNEISDIEQAERMASMSGGTPAPRPSGVVG